MATWFDVTAPANWAAVQTALVGTVSDCVSSASDTIDLFNINIDPDSEGFDPALYRARVERALTGPTYGWTGSVWAPSDYLVDAEVFAPPMLEYVGPLTGVEKIRVTAVLRNARTLAFDSIALPFASYPAGDICAYGSTVGLGYANWPGGASGYFPADTEFVQETTAPAMLVTAIAAKPNGDVGYTGIHEMMDIKKIEFYAAGSGEFWTDFTDAQEF